MLFCSDGDTYIKSSACMALLNVSQKSPKPVATLFSKRFLQALCYSKLDHILKLYFFSFPSPSPSPSVPLTESGAAHALRSKLAKLQSMFQLENLLIFLDGAQQHYQNATVINLILTSKRERERDRHATVPMGDRFLGHLYIPHTVEKREPIHGGAAG